MRAFSHAFSYGPVEADALITVDQDLAAKASNIVPVAALRDLLVVPLA